MFQEGSPYEENKEFLNVLHTVLFAIAQLVDQCKLPLPDLFVQFRFARYALASRSLHCEFPTSSHGPAVPMIQRIFPIYILNIHGLFTTLLISTCSIKYCTYVHRARLYLYNLVPAWEYMQYRIILIKFIKGTNDF